MSEHPVKRRKKLIEVAIPLEAINAASAREKSIRHGHPSTLHLWWARRPLAAARAVIFCQMVDDPSAVPEEFPTEEDQENERLRLFALISELVTWENTTNEQVLNRARQEIKRSWRRTCADNADHPEAAELFNPDKLPGFHDPFAGGGALPLEAQRLGLESYASDLNPVAVLINKAMIEIPPKFADHPPVNPESRGNLDVHRWRGAQGLAEDTRYYGKWIRDEAEKRIGSLYPKATVTAEMIHRPENARPDLLAYEGKELNVIAWIWVRTVKSPNPSFAHIDVPLASSFILSKKTGRMAYVEPVIHDNGYSFKTRIGTPGNLDAIESGTKLRRKGYFRCLMSGEPIAPSYIRDSAEKGEVNSRLMAVVVEAQRGRLYLDPIREHEEIANGCEPSWKPEVDFFEQALGFRIGNYGMRKWSDLFTKRQLTALSCISGLIKEVKKQIEQDAELAGSKSDSIPLLAGGSQAKAYAEAVGIYLSFALSKQADLGNSLCRWEPIAQCPRQLFGRQAIPMVWDYAEGNPLGKSSGAWSVFIEGISNAFAKSFEYIPDKAIGLAEQHDASTQAISKEKIVSTDPPYYDNIGYADLSDFFYVWLRRSIKDVYPSLFATVSVPKAEELVATPARHGGKGNAESFFLHGMGHAMKRIAKQAHSGFPVTIYYAFKQAETKGSAGTSSTGWETFLSAVIEAGLSISGTWPIRTENDSRLRGQSSNALATSMVLVCERRSEVAKAITRTEFRRRLRSELPQALKELEKCNIAPVDIAQASIGPGMAIYSNARAVLNPDDSPMPMREALAEINAALDEYLSEDETVLDPDSRFALTFFESYGYDEREFGDAESLAKARNVSVEGVADAGILRSMAGKVKLLQRFELPEDWDPAKDKRLCIWEATQQLIRRLEADGEGAAASLLSQLKQIPGHGDLAGNCRGLAYRLYNHCEKTKQAEEARAYNGLVIAWPELERLASSQSTETTIQASLI
jgi:putative DNA methylase